MGNVIRLATVADHLQMEEIWELSVKATHHFLAAQDIADIKAELPQIFATIACYVSVNKTRQIDGMLGLSGDQIAMLFVHPDAFGNGIGRKLMEFATVEHGIKKVEVNEQNPQAVGFYQHLGFEVTGRRPIDDQGRPFPILEMELK